MLRNGCPPVWWCWTGFPIGIAVCINLNVGLRLTPPLGSGVEDGLRLTVGGGGDVTMACGCMVKEKPSLGTCWARGPRRVSQWEDGGFGFARGLLLGE